MALPKAWPLATSPALLVAETRRPLVIEDAQHAAEFAGYRQDALARGYRTVVLLPSCCTNEDEHEMVLSIHTRERVAVSEHEIDFLVTAAHLVAIAVDKSKRLQRERRQSERLRDVLDTGASLMALVLEGASIDAIAGVVGAILTDPFVILDFVGGTTTVRHSAVAQTIGEKDWCDLVLGPGAPLLAGPGRAGPGRADLRLDLASIGVPVVLEVVVEPLRVHGETVGALLIFPRAQGIDGLDRVVAQDVRFALGAYVMSRHAEGKRIARSLSDFFEHLCRNGFPDPARARAQAVRLGLDLSGTFRLLAVTVPGKTGAMPGEVRRLIAANLCLPYPGAFVIEMEEVVAIGIPVRDLTHPAAEKSLERAIAQPIRVRWGVQPVIACGPPCAAPAEYAAAWAECRRVMEMARIFRRDGLLRQGDFGPSALLLSAFDSELIRAFVEDTLRALRRHDADHAGALLQTAITLVDEECRCQATAHRLGIHVSTLRHRLKRITELSGMHVGGWRHPESTLDDILEPSRYEHVARVLEAACFDGCFFADLFGLYDVHQGSFDAYLRRGGQISFLDPTVVLPVMAAATRHLGLGATLSTSFHTAYHLARWLGSLDAMSKGRVAWNVVTSATDLEAKNAGMLELLPPRGERYDRADEMLEACFALWDGWEADAFVMDKAAGVLADPAKVHYANYEGRWVRTRGLLSIRRSPQGRPVIMQAGSSDRGRDFAARSATTWSRPCSAARAN